MRARILIAVLVTVFVVCWLFLAFTFFALKPLLDW